MTYSLRTGDHPIEREAAPLIEKEFQEFEEFWLRHLQPLKTNGSWRPDMIEYLESIGMANFAILKSLNFINRQKTKIKVSDPDQSFKSIYFHFGLISDCIEDLSRNIVLIQYKLKIRKSDIRPQTKKELLAEFKEWITKKYKANCKDLIQKGKAIVYLPRPKAKFSSIIVTSNDRKQYDNLMESIRKYRNYYTHNPGVDIMRRGTELYVIKRDEVRESRSWSKLKTMLDTSTENFINPIEQVNNDLGQLLLNLRTIWKSFDKTMIEIESHKSFKRISIGFKRGDG